MNYEKYRNKRTEMDWSKHELIIKEDEFTKIFMLKKPDTVTYRVIFINTFAPSGDSILTVTGDFGNWVFCRPFVPSNEGYVEDHYWVEKLKIHSCQVPGSYDSEETYKEINEYYNSKLEDKGSYSKEEWGELEEWITRIKRYSDDELEYTYNVYREKPIFIDYEDIPFCKKISVQLDYIFDAFDEMCRRLS
jgi:hypothetical protein